jgi:hypothetical protein
MARAIAICKGGPLDGSAFSVELDEDGRPQPLAGRSEVCGVLYVPAGALPDVDNTGFETFEHEAAYEYVPEVK